MKTRVKTVILGPVVTVAGITAALNDIGSPVCEAISAAKPRVF